MTARLPFRKPFAGSIPASHGRLRSPGFALLLAAVAVAVVFSALRAQPAAAEGARTPAIAIEVKKGRLVRLKRPARTVFVADPAVADVQVKSPTLVYLFGKQAGDTTLIAVDDDEQVLLNSTVSVTLNLDQLRRLVGELVPRAEIRAQAAGSAIILSGTANSPTDVQNVLDLAARYVENKEEVINQIKVTGPNQVTLRVRVVEMSRDAMRDIGIDWNAVVQQGSFLAGIFSTVGTSTLIPELRGNRLLGGNTSFGLTALVRLMEQRGLVRVLAEPNLSALSGHTAHFLAGGEFPVPVPQSEGVTTIQYKRFGVSLSFTPVILPNDRISLKVAPEVSQLSSAGAVTVGGVQVPALTTRRAETTLELGSGQSLVIAGLIQRTSTRTLEQLPGLGEVPVVGNLFRSERFQRNETELVIIVTPYIASPTSGDEDDPRPRTATGGGAGGGTGSGTGGGDGRAVPPYQDPKRLFRNTSENGRNPPPNALSGRVGFIVE